jgi:chromosome segregation ATPase
VTDNVESLGEVARNLNLLRNKQVELFDRLGTLEERIQDLLNRVRPLEDRLARLEKASESRSPGYGR